MPAIGSGGLRPQAPLPKSKPPPPPPKPRAPSAANVLAATNPTPTHDSPAVASVTRAATKGLKAVAHTTHQAQSAGTRAASHVGRAVGAGVPHSAYRAAVIKVFRHQSQDGQRAILRGIQQNPNTFESKIISGYLRSQPDVLRGLLRPSFFNTPSNPISDIGHGLDTGLAGIKGILTAAPAPRQGGTEVAGFGGTPVTNVAVGAPIDIARAAIQDPSVIPKTVKGLSETALGSAAALVELPVNVVTEGPGKAFSQLGAGIAKDYSQRYGPLAAGNDQAFIARIKKHGAGAELLDALGVAGGLDATVGRAVAKLAKAREDLTGAPPGVFTKERPQLRVSGDERRPQHLAPTAGRILAQRVEDRLRGHLGGRELKLGPNEVAPVFQGRAMRVLVSGINAKTRHLMQGTLNKEVRHGAEPAVRKLSPWERRAFPFARGGTIPLRSGERAAFDAIEQRKNQILEDRARSPESPGNRIPEQHRAQVDEIPMLNDLQANISKWLTPRLADTVQREAERSIRLDRELPGSYLREPTAEAARLREQGTFLGHEHPYEADEKKVAYLTDQIKRAQRLVDSGGRSMRDVHVARARLARLRSRLNAVRAEEDMPARLKEYSAAVRKDARERGLPEPAYMRHQANPKANFANWTQGSGNRAIGMPKRSTFALFKSGAVYRDPQAYFDSLAKTIKAQHQWHLVDEQFRRSALPAPTREQIRAALGKDVHPTDLTGHQLAQVLEHSGSDLRQLNFYNPGRLALSTLEERGLMKGSRAAGVPPEMLADSELHAALNQEDTAVDGGKLVAGKLGNDEPFLTTKGWKALPRSAFEEIHSSTKPSEFAGRALGKAQGVAAMAILGLSPSFVIMNTLAHVFLATFGTGGKILTDAAKYPIWWHGLDDAQKAIIDSHAGGRGEFRVERIASTARNDLSRSWQRLKDQKILHFLTAANPVRMFFKVEDAQSNFFRRMVFYSQAKRMAFEHMTREMGPAVAAMNRLQHVFDVGPKREMSELIAHQADAEELGRRVVNMMGDYSRFTGRERRWLNNRAVLFYSFLRHATRTLLYVLPVKHPIATALVAELANLHNDEVRKMLGGQDMPWAYSRLYFQKNGHLTSIDFARASPVGGAFADVASQGLQGASGLIAPELQPLLDMMYGNTMYGSPVPANFFTLFNQYASLSYPYRLFHDLHFGTAPQQPDSIPFVHERPETRKTKEGKQYLAAKAKALGPLDQKLLAGFLGAYPKPDDTGVIAQHANAKIAAHKRALAKKKAGGSGGYLMGGTHSSGGYLMGGTHSSSGYLMP